MEKYRFRAMPSYSKEPTQRVDNQQGIIYGVVLAQKGLNKNETYFSDKFLSDLAKKGNERGYIKARFGHPNMCATSLGSYIGTYKNFRIENEKLIGDLHLSDIAKDTQVEGRGISMYDYVIKMASNHAEAFGNSIVILANTIEETYNDNGEEKTAFGHELIEWVASDLVDDPAATDSLFHSISSNDFGVILTDFLDENPQIFEILEQKPALFSDFLQRYTNYQTRKNKNSSMNILNTIKKAFEKRFDVDLTLTNGDIISVKTESEAPQVGDKVTQKTDNGQQVDKPLEDGEYTLTDGTKLTVKAGVIEQITPKEEPKKDDENAAFQNEMLKTLTFMADEFVKMKKEITTLKSVASRFSVEAPRGESSEKDTAQKSSLEEIRERMKSYR